MWLGLLKILFDTCKTLPSTYTRLRLFQNWMSLCKSFPDSTVHNCIHTCLGTLQIVLDLLKTSFKLLKTLPTKPGLKLLQISSKHFQNLLWNFLPKYFSKRFQALLRPIKTNNYAILTETLRWGRLFQTCSKIFKTSLRLFETYFKFRLIIVVTILPLVKTASGLNEIFRDHFRRDWYQLRHLQTCLRLLRLPRQLQESLRL